MRVVAAGGVVAAVAQVIADHLTNPMEYVVLIGAVVGALGIIHAKVMVPLVRLGRRTSAGVDILLDLPDWTERVDERLAHLESQARTGWRE